MPQFHDNAKLILHEIDEALAAVSETEVEALVDAVLGSEKVFVTGLGRVLLSLQAFVKRLNHLGVSAWYVGEMNEPALTERDLFIVGSGSGETAVPLTITRIARRLGARIVHIGSNPRSSLSPLTDLFVRIPVRTKLDLPEEIPSRQIMSSLFEQCLLILGDAVALRIAERKSITDIKALWTLHANLE